MSTNPDNQSLSSVVESTQKETSSVTVVTRDPNYSNKIACGIIDIVI